MTHLRPHQFPAFQCESSSLSEHPAAQPLSSITMIERLVALDTTSYKTNLRLIEMAADILTGLGASIRLTWDKTRHKANIFATIGPQDRAGIVLSGHTDVVPVDGQDWSSDPFCLARHSGYGYGYGDGYGD